MFISLRLVDNAEPACFEFSTRSMPRKHGGNHLTRHAHLPRPNLLGPCRDFCPNFVSLLITQISKAPKIFGYYCTSSSLEYSGLFLLLIYEIPISHASFLEKKISNFIRKWLNIHSSTTDISLYSLISPCPLPTKSSTSILKSSKISGHLPH